MQHPSVRAHELKKAYGSVFALDGLNLEIQPSRVTAILGPNGAGKTTFIRCALGLTQPSSGSVSVFGRPPGERASRYRTGAMLQDANLPDVLTPSEHVTLYASYYRKPMSIDRVIDLCGMSEFANTRYGRLSGGQKRRVQFALSIVGQPELLFLDEPTTGLDADARTAAWDLVRELAAGGCSVVLTTHYLEEAEALADNVVLLADGQTLVHADTATLTRTVSGDIIRCVTTLAIASLAGITGVTQVSQTGRFVELRTLETTVTLRELLSQDTHVAEISVTKPNLESAIATLTASKLDDSRSTEHETPENV